MALELGNKVGPLPVWGWAVVVAVGGYVLYKKLLSGGGSSAATSNATSPGQAAQDGTGIGTGGFVPIYLSPGSTSDGSTGGTPSPTGGATDCSQCEQMTAAQVAADPFCMECWASHVGTLGDPIAAINQGVFNIPGQPGLVSINGVTMQIAGNSAAAQAVAAARQQVDAALRALPLVPASAVDPSNTTPGAVVPAVGNIPPGTPTFPPGSNQSTAPGSAGAYGIAQQQQAAAKNAQPNQLQQFMSVLSGRG